MRERDATFPELIPLIGFEREGLPEDPVAKATPPTARTPII
jgi:hypothetical protein